MTRFTVVYVVDAQNALANAWLSHPDQEAVRKAAEQIDRELHDAPRLYGTHLREGLWLISEGPLTVFFTISDEDCLVEVGGVCLNKGPTE